MLAGYALRTLYYSRIDAEPHSIQGNSTPFGFRPFPIHYLKIWNIVVTNERETNICEWKLHWKLSNTAQFISTGIPKIPKDN